MGDLIPVVDSLAHLGPRTVSRDVHLLRTHSRNLGPLEP